MRESMRGDFEPCPVWPVMLSNTGQHRAAGSAACKCAGDRVSHRRMFEHCLLVFSFSMCVNCGVFCGTVD
jgi:hypothetical protein